jgi:hypothetical protein
MTRARGVFWILGGSIALKGRRFLYDPPEPSYFPIYKEELEQAGKVYRFK